MIIGYYKKFIKGYRKLSQKVKRVVDEKIGQFSDDPFAEILNNHSLKAEFEGFRSINITGNYRAIYREISKTEVMFVLIGTHAQLYDR